MRTHIHGRSPLIRCLNIFSLNLVWFKIFYNDGSHIFFDIEISQNKTEWKNGQFWDIMLQTNFGPYLPKNGISVLLSEIICQPRVFFMPPTSEEVEGAYWFGSVRAVQCSAVSQSVMRLGLSVQCSAVSQSVMRE